MSASALRATFQPGRPVPASGRLLLWGDDLDVAAAATELGLPEGDEVQATLSVPIDGGVEAREVAARAVAIMPAVRVLAALPTAEDWPSWRRPSGAILAWSAAAKLALEFVAAGRLVPTLRPGTHTDPAAASWRAVPPRDGRLEKLAYALPPCAHALSRDGDRLWTAFDLLVAFCDAVADACGRAGRRPDGSGRRRAARPWPEAWYHALASADPYVVDPRRSVDPHALGIQEWVEPVLDRQERARARLALRVEAPDPDVGSGDVAPDGWRVHLVLQSSDDLTATVPAGAVWTHVGGPFHLAGRNLQAPDEVLLRGLAEASELFAPLDRALDERWPDVVEVSTAEAAGLLGKAGDDLRDAGIGLVLPAEVEAARTHRLRARLRIDDGELDPGRVRETEVDLFSEASLTDVRFEVALGDDRLTAQELARLADLGSPLVHWKGRWARLDTDDLEQLADLDGQRRTLGVREALVAALSGEHRVDGVGSVDVVADGAFGRLVQRLRQADGPGQARIDRRFVGDLRPYQRRGVAWLQRLSELGLGGVLADHMGLGKTVQAIAFMVGRPRRQPHLVVCPTSVVGNWEREIARFAPDAQVVRYHGPDRPDTLDAFTPGSVTVTSYALLRRDIDLLENVDWDVVVYDEAQQVKNVASKGAKAARVLPANVRLAMTGTPIENRLSELWAIVDLTNPGLLGSLRRFTEHYAVPIERWRDDEAATRLRRLVAPFILRREKTDPEVAVDLPPKQEITVPVSLTPEQARLYQAAVDAAFSQGKLTEDRSIGRRGRVLALLTALKQICNHPAHYLAQTGPLEHRSGKLDRATEILEEIVAAGDRALVFTQYRKMGDLLIGHLRTHLELPEVPFLHGGVARVSRDRMVDRFQQEDDAPPILLVSLRAGGTGLNLTRATEVVHFDRWWNPAVEDQATDRTHRIGQTRAVTVHTLVASGTVEDRVAELLERKRALAASVVGAGEAWLTELGESELFDLVALSPDDIADADDDDDDDEAA
ncbi:MAG TPA: DEAD/DEAH box helicase [Nitriliruptorales bacterium]